MLVVAVYGDLFACKGLNHLPLLRVFYLVSLIPLDTITVPDPFHSPAFDKKHPQELILLGHFQRVPCIWVVFHILSQIPSGVKSVRNSPSFFRIKEIKDVDVDSFQGLKRNETSAWVRRWGKGAHLFAFVDGWWNWTDSAILAERLPSFRHTGVAAVIQVKLSADPSSPFSPSCSPPDVKALKAA